MSKRGEKPLPNKCGIAFKCNGNNCAYFKKDGGGCKYNLFPYYDCVSLVAQANAMVLELQRMGFTVEFKKKQGGEG